jgi:cytidyltransferase-like protein
MIGNRTIIVTGCFDIIHAGHIKLLHIAKVFAGDSGKVIVLLDSDERVAEMKGDDRPINTWMNRRDVLLALKYVDDVRMITTDGSIIQAIKSYRPNNNSENVFRVIGTEYIDKLIIGKELFEDVIYVDKQKDLSTTQIIDKIKES